MLWPFTGRLLQCTMTHSVYLTSVFYDCQFYCVFRHFDLLGYMAFVFQLVVTNDSFQNALNAARFSMVRNRNKLGTVPDRTE